MSSIHKICSEFIAPDFCFFMVGMRGFEPPTPASRTQCSTGLSHIPNENDGLAFN